MRRQIMILSLFAMLWGLATCAITGATGAYLALPLAITALVIFMGWKLLPPTVLSTEENRRIRTLIRLWSAIEVAAMIAAIFLLQRAHATYFLPAAIAIIVGLHFLPLARGFPERWFYLAGLGLIGVGLIAFALPLRLQMPVPLAAGAVVLWLSAVGIIVSRAPRAARA